MSSLVDPVFGLGGVGGLWAALFGPKYFVFGSKVYARQGPHHPDANVLALVTTTVGVVGGAVIYVAWRLHLALAKRNKSASEVLSGGGFAALPDDDLVAVHTLNHRMAEKQRLQKKLANLTQAMKVDSLLGRSPPRPKQRQQDQPPLPDADPMQCAFVATKSCEVLYAALNYLEVTAASLATESTDDGELNEATGVSNVKKLVATIRATALQVSGGVDRAKAAAVLSVSSRLNNDWYGTGSDGGEMTDAQSDGTQKQEPQSPSHRRRRSTKLGIISGLTQNLLKLREAYCELDNILPPPRSTPVDSNKDGDESTKAALLWRDSIVQLELQAALSMMATEAVQVLTCVDFIVGHNASPQTDHLKSFESLQENAKQVAELSLTLVDSVFEKSATSTHASGGWWSDSVCASVRDIGVAARNMEAISSLLWSEITLSSRTELPKLEIQNAVKRLAEQVSMLQAVWPLRVLSLMDSSKSDGVNAATLRLALAVFGGMSSLQNTNSKNDNNSFELTDADLSEAAQVLVALCKASSSTHDNSTIIRLKILSPALLNILEYRVENMLPNVTPYFQGPSVISRAQDIVSAVSPGTAIFAQKSLDDLDFGKDQSMSHVRLLLDEDYSHRSGELNWSSLALLKQVSKRPALISQVWRAVSSFVRQQLPNASVGVALVQGSEARVVASCASPLNDSDDGQSSNMHDVIVVLNISPAGNSLFVFAKKVIASEAVLTSLDHVDVSMSGADQIDFSEEKGKEDGVMGRNLRYKIDDIDGATRNGSLGSDIPETSGSGYADNNGSIGDLLDCYESIVKHVEGDSDAESVRRIVLSPLGAKRVVLYRAGAAV